MSDEREIEYLMIFLNIELNLQTKFTQLVPALEQFTADEINQAILSRQAEIRFSLLERFAQPGQGPNSLAIKVLETLQRALEVKMHSHEMDLALHLGLVDCLVDEYRHPVNFSFIVIPENYLALHERYFYKNCSKCNCMGLLALCLICGDAVCLKDCELEENDEPQKISKT
jgi:Proteolysis_6 C-terminal